MYTLQNEALLININAKGAELTRIFHKQNGLEYLWDAKPEVWGKHAPVLFPIVGTLKDNTYYYQGKTYQLTRHGFARDRVFERIDPRENAISFSLGNDAGTEAVFPFRFLFTIRYILEANTLSVTYSVNNPGSTTPLFFSVGGHPAFRLPLEAGLAYEDYTLHFNKVENTGRWPISKEGLIEQKSEPLLQNTNQLPLSKSLFAKDAVVLKTLQSDAVELRSSKSAHGLRFSFPGFPFLGLWAAPGADFLCIEPWCGIADGVKHDQQLEHKEGIIHLAAGATFSATWTATFF